MELQIAEIIRQLHGVPNPNYHWVYEKTISGVSTDSRSVKTGELFVPIVGENFDGHYFIKGALDNGAACVLANFDYPCSDLPVIQVENPHQGLKDLAEYYMGKFDMPVVAITGSTGKTTTKDMAASVVEQKYKILKTQGNLNNEIGLPLTVFKMTGAEEAAVLELGMNQFGEIENLSKIVKPDICMITNIGVTHIEYLGSIEGILQAKCEIFSHMKPDGTVILNKDDLMLQTLEGKYKNMLYFGCSPDADVYVSEIVSKGLEGIQFLLHVKEHQIPVSLPYPGNHMAINAAAAAAVGFAMGLSPAEIKAGLESFVPSKMRMIIKKLPHNITLIDDVYNSSPISLRASLDTLSEAKTRKVAILGDMRELGKLTDECHYEAGLYIAQKDIDVIVAIGSKMKNLHNALLNTGRELYYYSAQEDFFPHIHEIIKENDTVLVKASRGIYFEKTVQKIQEVVA